MNKVMKQIDEDLLNIKKIITNEIKYPAESIETIQKRINHNSDLILSKKTLSAGEWAQVFTGRQPFYAKINHISKDNFATLEGIYNYDLDNPNNKQSNSFPLDQMLPVSEKLGFMLEYANGNNKALK